MKGAIAILSNDRRQYQLSRPSQAETARYREELAGNGFAVTDNSLSMDGHVLSVKYMNHWLFITSHSLEDFPTLEQAAQIIEDTGLIWHIDGLNQRKRVIKALRNTFPISDPHFQSFLDALREEMLVLINQNISIQSGSYRLDVNIYSDSQLTVNGQSHRYTNEGAKDIARAVSQKRTRDEQAMLVRSGYMSEIPTLGERIKSTAYTILYIAAFAGIALKNKLRK